MLDNIQYSFYHDFVRLLSTIHSFHNGDIYQDNTRRYTVRLFIEFNHNDNYNAWQLDLKICPRFLLNQRWKSLSLCPAAPFLDVSVWRSIGNTVRRCRCHRIGLETNSSSIMVRWRPGRWRIGGDTLPVRFAANRKIRRFPRGESKTPPTVTSATVAFRSIQNNWYCNNWTL